MRVILLLTVFLFIPAVPSASQTADPLAIRIDELGARLRFLSSDLLQGRYPGTTSEHLTTSYLISELQSFGVHPGAGDSWLQAVSIVVHEAVSGARSEARITGHVSRTLEHGRDVRLSNFTNRADVQAGGELVFVGYGIYAPVYSWDDFKGVDLRGKVAIALSGEPSIPGDSVFFNGIRASRYSWGIDKVAEMARRGAVGVLWIRPAGSLSRAPSTGSARLLQDATSDQLLFTGALTDSTLGSLIHRGLSSLADLMASTSRSDFQPLQLGSRIDVRFQTAPKVIKSNNVVGLVLGTDPTLANEHIVISAHWDALGITRPVNGDSICNGALDDGSGLTYALALARVFASNPQPRPITFLFCTAEEFFLLGADAFIRFGPLPPTNIIANLNLDDGGELFGAKHDVAPLGVELSTLGQTVFAVASRKGLRVSPDPFPEEGFFLRADNFPFARMGVPALYMALGTDDIDHPQGWTKTRVEEYLKQHYHQPSDNYETVVLDLRGALQLAEFTRDVTIAIAQAKRRPEWLPGAEFSRPNTINSPSK
jgi:hypothetical protein